MDAESGMERAWERGSHEGILQALEKGTFVWKPDLGQYASFHAVDSSKLAFRLAAIGAFPEAFLEPIMTVEVVTPVEFQSLFLPFLSYALLSLC